jgi:ethanolamine utilization protein EutA
LNLKAGSQLPAFFLNRCNKLSNKIINSVGIDVGTTTTQVIFSSLVLRNIAAPTQVPHFEFVDRKVLYSGKILFTPFNSDGSIDHIRLWEMVLDEYKKAGFGLKEIETGAIIITGETSKAKNAKTTLMKLAGDLGDFVVATAGPHFESVIAGRGSGSSVYSEEHTTTVLNIDIGGGTSNYAVFRNGRIIDTCCLNVGGRLIQTDKNGKVTKITEPAKKILKNIIPNFQEDYDSLSLNDIKSVCDVMADLIIECIEGNNASPLEGELLQTNPLKQQYTFGAVFLSGGVGECYYKLDEMIKDRFQFSDLGVLLAEALMKNNKLKKYNVIEPNQTIRATVIGAGAYTLSLSGSTIWLTAENLPLRNLPVLHPHFDWNDANSSLSYGIEEAAKTMDISLSNDEYAIYLPEEIPVTYRAVQKCAEELITVLNKHRKEDNSPVIILAFNDIGKVLGMELSASMKSHPLAIIDEVVSYEGDYIDIGKSYFGGEIVPLTIKSLAFP